MRTFFTVVFFTLFMQSYNSIAQTMENKEEIIVQFESKAQIVSAVTLEDIIQRLQGIRGVTVLAFCSDKGLLYFQADRNLLPENSFIENIIRELDMSIQYFVKPGSTFQELRKEFNWVTPRLQKK